MFKTANYFSCFEIQSYSLFLERSMSSFVWLCIVHMVLKASALGRLGDATASKRLPAALKKGPL
jgi:hypothetical protein